MSASVQSKTDRDGNDLEQTLQRVALFESIIESMSEAVLVVDRDGKQLFANRVQRGYREGDEPARGNEDWDSAYTVFDVEGRALKYEDWPIARTLRGEYVDNFEMRVRGVPGLRGDAAMLTSSRPLLDKNGQPAGAVVVTRDVTAIRATEDKLRQSQKLETVGQLTGGIAHDFNNMLAAILSSVEVLKKAVGETPRLMQAAQTVERAAMRGADLTRHLLAFARKQTLSPVPVDVDALVREALSLLRPALSANIKVRVQSQGSIFALADHAQLTSVLLNLCINARDAMFDSGEIIIDVAERQVEPGHAWMEPGAYVRLAVTDNGVGMSPEVQARAIEPFFTTKDIGEGSGLGLSMVYGFVRQSGGDVRIESQEGVGTTVSILLPRTEAEPAAPAPPELEQPGRLRILIVDDDDLVRDALCLQLQDEGYLAKSACDGREALGMLRDGLVIDLLITDMVMPGGISGVDLAAKARLVLPGVRVILSTGYTEEELPDLGLSDGTGPGSILLRKPYTADQLLIALRTAMLGG